MRHLFSRSWGQDELGDDPSTKWIDPSRFWSSIWSVEKRRNKDASWLDEVRDRMGSVEKPEEVKISVEDVENGIRKITN